MPRNSRWAALLLCLGLAIAWHAGDAFSEQPEPGSLAGKLIAEGAESLAAEARRSGDARRGAVIFHQARLTCIVCHGTTDAPPVLGPDLSEYDQEVTAEYVIESVLEPSKVIRKGYQTAVVVDEAGNSHTGLLVEQRPDAVIIRQADQQGVPTVIPAESIDAWRMSEQSIMPDGLVNLLAGRHEFLDLAAYLIVIAEGGPEVARQLQPHPSLYLPPPAAPDTTIDQLQVYRTMMPETGPASLVLGLGHQLWVVFDPQRGGLTYAWRGGLDLSPVHAQKINLPAEPQGELFYHESLDRPLRPSEGARRSEAATPPELRFLGYRMTERGVQLRYQLGSVLVRDQITALGDGSGIQRQLRFRGDVDAVQMQLEPQAAATVRFDQGTVRQGVWRLDIDDSAGATMVIRAATVQQGDD